MLPEASLFCDILCVRNWTLKLLSSIPRPVWWDGLMMFYGHEHAVKFKCIGFTSSSWTFFNAHVPLLHFHSPSSRNTSCVMWWVRCRGATSRYNNCGPNSAKIPGLECAVAGLWYSWLSGHSQKRIRQPLGWSEGQKDLQLESRDFHYQHAVTCWASSNFSWNCRVGNSQDV